MKNKINYIISLICTALFCSFIIPIKITNSFNNKTYYGKTNILYFINNKGICTNCNEIKILWILLILEFIIFYIVINLILKIIDKSKKRK